MHNIAESFACDVTGKRTAPVDNDLPDDQEDRDTRMPRRWAKVTITWVEELPAEVVSEEEVETFVAAAIKATGQTPPADQLAQLRAFSREQLQAQAEPAGLVVEEIEAHIAPEGFGFLALIGLEDRLPSWVKVPKEVEAAMAALDAAG